LNLDMTGAINRYNGLAIPLSEIEFIGLKSTLPFMGNMLGGCWCADDTSTGDMVLLTHISDNYWKFEIDIPAGINAGMYEYKFAVMYSGADTINGGFEPLNNEFTDSISHNFILTDILPTITIYNLFGDPNPVGVEKIDNLLPLEYNLHQNYPNPFNPTTKIRYSIPEYSSVTLKVFNLLGEEIETLFSGDQSAGVYEAAFDASNLSSGIYFYSLQTREHKFTRKMMLLK
jgi:Secretion system C-terminal sorting domain